MINSGQGLRIRVYSVFFLAACCLLLAAFLCGCETLRRKFIRNPKHEKKAEEAVFVPQEYGPEFEKETLYKKYLVYWRSWQDELITAIEANLSYKKQIDCAEQAVANLEKLRTFLKEEKQNTLDIYLSELKKLRDEIKSGVPAGAGIEILKNRLRINRRNILHNFMYSKVKDDLK